jgi:magnesium and cobalt transporter
MVDAKTNMDEIAHLFSVDLEIDEGFDTVGGLVTYALGHVGEVGEEVVVGGVRFVVREANERCVLRVEVSRVEGKTDGSVLE